MVMHHLGEIRKHVKRTMNQLFGVKLRVRTLPQSRIQNTNNAQCIIKLCFPLFVHSVHGLSALLFTIVVRATLGNGFIKGHIINECFTHSKTSMTYRS